jgi:hypothetical protein
MGSDISEAKQVRLAECRIVALLRRRFAAVARPGHHVGDRTRRPVAVEHLQRQVLQRELFLNALQQRADLAFHHAFGGVIPPERTADEIVGARVTHILNDRRIDIAQINEAGGQFWRLRGGARQATRRDYRHERRPSSHTPAGERQYPQHDPDGLNEMPHVLPSLMHRALS